MRRIGTGPFTKYDERKMITLKAEGHMGGGKTLLLNKIEEFLKLYGFEVDHNTDEHVLTVVSVDVLQKLLPITTRQRPANCRNELRDAGEPYPRSGCAVCGSGGINGCPYEGRK